MGILQSQTKKLQFYLENDVLSSIYPPPATEVIKIPSKKPLDLSLQNAQNFILHAQPTDGDNQNIVSGQDGRERILNPAKWPNSVHGVVAAKFPGEEGNSWGTGTLIGPNIVLTAGHNLYKRKSKKYADLESIQFLPGMSGHNPQFGVIKVEQLFVSDNYVKEDKDDFGILVLKDAIGDQTGYFGLVCLESDQVREKTLHVTGYPGDKMKNGSYEMWGMKNTGASIDKNVPALVNYQIDTATGQSGSGVWYKEGEEYYICGIHVKGGSIFNQGTFLTKAVYKQVYECIQKSNFKEFLLKLEKTKNLEFKNHKINVDCLSLLMKYKLDNLAILNLSNQELDEKGAVTLASNTSWINLSGLNLSKNRLTAKGIEAIAQNTFWKNLTHLDLSDNAINKEGAAALANNQSWVKLTHLNLAWNSLHAEGVIALAKNSSWKSLLHLDLSYNLIESEGALALAQNTVWKELESLKLQFNSFGAFGATVLTKNTFWTKLKHLDLSKNDISKGKAKQVLSSNIHFKSLVVENDI